MRKISLVWVLWAAMAGPAFADGLVLKDGRKIVGRVVEKPDGFEITVEGQVLAFAKDDVRQWIKSPKDLLGDADRLFAEAKQIYLEAVEMKDARAADARFREALPKVVRAREAYAEARDFFPDGHPELDTQLVNIMKLMRLVRERIGSEIASGAPAVKPKEAPPPRPAVKPAAEIPAPAPAPPPAGPVPAWAEAVAILADPVRRSEPARRALARAAFQAVPAGSPAADVAAAASYFLARDEKQWALSAEQAQALQELLEAFRAETSASGRVPWAALRSAAGRLRDDAGAGPLALFFSAAASSWVAAQGGQPPAELEACFKELGFEKSEFGAVWGRPEHLALDDFRKWTASAEYGLAIVQFQKDYRSLPSFSVRYALGILYLLQALADGRSFLRAASYLEQQSRQAPTPAARDHLLALARSIRTAAPCLACGGTDRVNCPTCKGRQRVNLECVKCGGSGKINTFNGIKICPGCQGKGRFSNVDCPRCKATGKVECKARGCPGEVRAPSFESFAEAYACPDCRGKGTLFRHVAYPCSECSGLGLILQPKADPSKLLRP